MLVGLTCFPTIADKAYTYLTNALSIGTLSTSGEDFNKILPPMSMFGSEDVIASYTAKKEAIIADLNVLFYEYKGVYVDLTDYYNYSATPAEWWKSGRQGVPSPVPHGYCAYLVMQAVWRITIQMAIQRRAVKMPL